MTKHVCSPFPSPYSAIPKTQGVGNTQVIDYVNPTFIPKAYVFTHKSAIWAPAIFSSFSLFLYLFPVLVSIPRISMGSLLIPNLGNKALEPM